MAGTLLNHYRDALDNSNRLNSEFLASQGALATTAGVAFVENCIKAGYDADAALEELTESIKKYFNGAAYATTLQDLFDC